MPLPSDSTNTVYDLREEPMDSLTFFPVSNESARALLGKDAELVWSCVASSWDEAQTKKHEFLGWKPYVPMR